MPALRVARRRARRRTPGTEVWRSQGRPARRVLTSLLLLLVGRSAPQLLEALVAATVPSVIFVPDRILLVVFLVILLRRVELGGGGDLGHDGVREALGVIEAL